MCISRHDGHQRASARHRRRGASRCPERRRLDDCSDWYRDRSGLPPTTPPACAKHRRAGLIVTEFPPGSIARPAHFPQRNRIISGLAMATLVVEAAQRSGSLITARLAAEQGREVFALPGSIHNPQCRGCHQLIRDGAGLAESAADILSDLGSLFHYNRQQLPGDRTIDTLQLDNDHRALLESIGYDPVDCDILVRRSGLTIDKLSSMLVTLELNDLIQSAPGGCFVRI